VFGSWNSSTARTDADARTTARGRYRRLASCQRYADPADRSCGGLFSTEFGSASSSTGTPGDGSGLLFQQLAGLFCGANPQHEPGIARARPWRLCACREAALDRRREPLAGRIRNLPYDRATSKVWRYYANGTSHRAALAVIYCGAGAAGLVFPMLC